MPKYFNSRLWVIGSNFTLRLWTAFPKRRLCVSCANGSDRWQLWNGQFCCPSSSLDSQIGLLLCATVCRWFFFLILYSAVWALQIWCRSCVEVVAWLADFLLSDVINKLCDLHFTWILRSLMAQPMNMIHHSCWPRASGHWLLSSMAICGITPTARMRGYLWGSRHKVVDSVWSPLNPTEQSSEAKPDAVFNASLKVGRQSLLLDY